MFGRQDYRSRDEARNNWVVALLVFGEGWHNNHHAFPGVGAARAAALAARRVVVGDPRAREARSRLEREGAGRGAARAAPRSGRLKPRELVRDESRPGVRARQRQRPSPVRAERDSVQRPRNERVLAFGAERSRALEAASRARGRDAGNAREPAVERPVQHGEAAAAQRGRARPLGEPRRETDDGLDGRRRRRPAPRRPRPSRSRAAGCAARRSPRSLPVRPRCTSRAGSTT